MGNEHIHDGRPLSFYDSCPVVGTKVDISFIITHKKREVVFGKGVRTRGRRFVIIYRFEFSGERQRMAGYNRAFLGRLFNRLFSFLFL